MKKITEIIIDDIDQRTEGAVTIEFSYKGLSYSIDLAEKNEAKMDKALDPFILAATQVKRPSSSIRRSSSTKRDSSVIRDWAKTQRLEVSERGRVPKAIIEAYDAAH